MNRAILLALFSISLLASTSDAASVYFRGNINAGLIPAGDPLGIGALPSTNFEALINTNGVGGITGSYIVFQGRYFNFTNGTFTPATNVFTGMTLLNPITNTSTGFNIVGMDFPGSSAGDTQAALNALIGSSASFAIQNGGGLTYLGTITAVPEPASMFALTGLVIGFGGYQWRRRSRKQVA